jgi:hypothetical protein
LTLCGPLPGQPWVRAITDPYRAGSPLAQVETGVRLAWETRELSGVVLSAQLPPLSHWPTLWIACRQSFSHKWPRWGCQMEQSAKETVIIVHGTWASPDAGQDPWYHPSSNPPADGFISRLNAALQERGSMAQCWSHCPEGGQPFYWSGENSWFSRTRAADVLADYILKLQKEGWLCHVVAHSHGGNVVAEALPKILAASDFGAPLGRVVTLGTPFIDATTPILESETRRQITLLGLCYIGFVNSAMFVLRYPETHLVFVWGVLSSLLLGALIFRWTKLRLGQTSLSIYLKTNGRSLAPEIAFWTFAGMLVYFIAKQDIISITMTLGLFLMALFARHTRRQIDKPNKRRTPNLAKNPKTYPQLLAIGSRMDEAWQVLHHMRNSDNPIAIRSNLALYLISAFRSGYAQRAAADRLYYGSFQSVGWAAGLAAIVIWFDLAFSTYVIYWVFWPSPDDPSPDVGFQNTVLVVAVFFSIISLSPIVLGGNKFFAAFLFPLRWCGRILSSLASVGTAIGTYVVRKVSWSVFLKIAMGLEGYRLKLPIIEQRPTYISAKFVKYEEMPASAERLALKRRGAWIERHMEDVSETFSKLVITAADISLLLGKIESDRTLVHAAYYTDDRCIAQIANWLAADDS